MQLPPAHSADDRIAVVGMAVKYAGCNNKEEFWNTLMNGSINTKPISATRLGSNKRDEHYVPERSKYADTFCNEKYGCIQQGTDNEHDLLLGLAQEALTDAAERMEKQPSEAFDLANTGIVSGCLSFPMDNLQGELLNLYQSHVEKQLPPSALVEAVKLWSERKKSTTADAGNKQRFMDPASFVADKLNLSPLHYAIDAACASALYVLKLAQDHLVSGAVDMMLCGATCFPEPFFILSGFSTFQAMPVGEDGVSLPLHKTSAGLTPGEGGSIMVLKRLKDAVRDGNHIYGVLLEANLSNAGCGLPLSPHLPSEESCIRDTYRRAGVAADQSIQYIECHATGTPRGDVVEIEAVERVFKENVPRLGSTKGNFGHSLVAAGFAGMAKLLLAMEHGVIPPTPGLDASNQASEHVVTKAITWPETQGAPKRAGLSAFGFGGTNAHALFEEFNTEGIGYRPKKPPIESNTHPSVVITGMDCTFGSLEGIDAFETALYEGRDAARDLPAKRWRFLGEDLEFLHAIGLKEKPRGCFVESVDVNFRRLKTPLTPEDMLRPQQLLAVSTMDRAIVDAGLKKGQHVAVLVGLGTDLELYRHRARVALKEVLHPSIKSDPAILQKIMQYVNDAGTSTSYTSYIGNLVATRISSQWGFTGPSFTVTEGNNSVYRCAQLAKDMLQTNRVDAVVIAGVDLNGSAESFFVRANRQKVSKLSHPCASFDRNADGFFAGEGCGALVLKRLKDCAPQEKTYASIDSITIDKEPTSSAVKAIHLSDSSLSDIELLEISGDSTRFAAFEGAVEIESSVEAQLKGLSKVLEPAKGQGVAVGSARATVGDAGYATGAASLIKTALCLYNRYLPAVSNWSGPYQKSVWGSNMFVCHETRPWMKSQDEKRCALISGTDPSHTCFSLVLSDTGCYEEHNRMCFDEQAPQLVLIHGFDGNTIVRQLEGYLLELVEGHASPLKYFQNLIGQSLFENSKENQLTLSLVCNPNQLQKELMLAIKGVQRSMFTGKDWVSPSGSYFAPNPLSSAKVAFMYGEGRSPYCGVGLGLHRLWPGLHENVNNKTVDLWTEGDNWLYPRTLTREEHTKAIESFNANQIEMFRAGIFISMCQTDFVMNVLGVQPKAGFGLSLGEISMLFAMSKENCRQSQEMTNRLRSSPVWSKELAVNFNAIRNLWKIPQGAPLKSFWQGYLVHGTREEIEHAIGPSEPYVRLLIVHDSRSAVIAGKPDACQAVISRLNSKLPSLPVKQGMIGHCPEVRTFIKEIGYIHETLRISNDYSDCQLFSAVTKGTLDSSTIEIKYFVGEVYSRIADFPQIVNTVHSAGYDVFLELGCDASRSAAVQNILGGQGKFLSTAIDKKGQSAWSQVLRATASLAAHRVPGISILDLFHPKFRETCCEVATTPKVENKFLRTIQINGRFEKEMIRLEDTTMSCLPAPSEENIAAIQARSIRSAAARSGRSHDYAPLSPEENTNLCAEKLKFDSVPVAINFDDDNRIQLGHAGFRDMYNTKYSLYTGAMAKGIASADLVIAAGKEGILASYGAGGLPLATVRKGIDKIQQALPSGPYAVNLIHSPFDGNLEQGNVDLFLEKKVRVAECSAFTTLTMPVVHYRAAGLVRRQDGSILIKNRIIAKVSRTELAEMFLRPAPKTILEKLVAAGSISPDQAHMAAKVPMADDIAVEADSGGHTDNRPMHVVFPLIVQLRNTILAEYGYATAFRTRIGAGGGIGCPSAALAAFDMGASFVVTGSINQICREAGTCDTVRELLTNSSYSDVTMAPAADMFDQGVKLQVLKRGTMFPSRANKLRELFVNYESIETLPLKELKYLENTIFKQRVDQVWDETKRFYCEKLNNPDKIARAMKDPKLKMSLCFRWYLSKSSGWANAGVKSRALDYQIWCGPAMGSFNNFASGTSLDWKVTGVFPGVAEVNMAILDGARELAAKRN